MEKIQAKRHSGEEGFVTREAACRQNAMALLSLARHELTMSPSQIMILVNAQTHHLSFPMRTLSVSEGESLWNMSNIEDFKQKRREKVFSVVVASTRFCQAVYLIAFLREFDAPLVLVRSHHGRAGNGWSRGSGDQEY